MKSIFKTYSVQFYLNLTEKMKETVETAEPQTHISLPRVIIVSKIVPLKLRGEKLMKRLGILFLLRVRFFSILDGAVDFLL